MSGEIKAKIGTKANLKDIDPKKTVKTQPTPPLGTDVQGQSVEQRLVICPWCGGASWIWYDSSDYHWYTCCHCGNAFTA